MAISVRVTGGRRVKRNTAKAVDRIQRNLAVEMRKAGHYIVGQAIPMTPKDEGNLRNSFHVDVEGSRRTPVLIVRNNAEYATPVHENLTANFTVGGPKFLERAVNMNISKIVNFLRNAIRRA